MAPHATVQTAIIRARDVGSGIGESIPQILHRNGNDASVDIRHSKSQAMQSVSRQWLRKCARRASPSNPWGPLRMRSRLAARSLMTQLI